MRRWPSISVWILFGVEVLMVSLIALMACVASQENDSAQPSPRPGLPEVYSKIGDSSNCIWLQEQFNVAMANFDRSEKGSKLSKITQSYAEAADPRFNDYD